MQRVSHALHNVLMKQRSCLQTQNQWQETWSLPWLWSSTPGWNMSSGWWPAMPSEPGTPVHRLEALGPKKQVNTPSCKYAQHYSHILSPETSGIYSLLILLSLQYLQDPHIATSWPCYVPIVDILHSNWAKGLTISCSHEFQQGRCFPLKQPVL